jgi:hypothetical protein
MIIENFLDDTGSFAPADLNVMSDAFSAALAKLGLCDRQDAMVEMVACRIVRAAFAGERDPIRLTEVGVGGCW